MAQLLRQVSTYLINKGLRLLILMFVFMLQHVFLARFFRLIVFFLRGLLGLMSRSVKF